MEIKELYEALGENKDELLAKALHCKNAEDLLSLAKENNLTIDKETSQKIINLLTEKSRALSDQELDIVTGGDRPITLEGINLQVTTTSTSLVGKTVNPSAPEELQCRQDLAYTAACPSPKRAGNDGIFLPCSLTNCANNREGTCHFI